MKSVVQISEKAGTGGVKPHNAILKGELIERIKIKYMIGNKNIGGTAYKLQQTLEVKMFSSATVWEFIMKVAKAVGIAPRYSLLELQNGTVIQNTQYGMVI